MTKEQLKKEKMKKVKEQIDYYYYGTYYGLRIKYIFMVFNSSSNR